MTKDKARLLNELFSVFTASKEDTEDNRKIIREIIYTRNKKEIALTMKVEELWTTYLLELYLETEEMKKEEGKNGKKVR